MRLLPLLLGSALLAHSAHADQASDFRALVDRFYAAALPFTPTGATALGFHEYDGRLEDWSESTRSTEVRGLHYFMSKFDALSSDKLDQATRGDLAIMRNTLRSQLLTLETIKPWQKNPDLYPSGITSAAYTLIERDFASPDDRLRSLISRERAMPRMLEEGKANLQNPPEIYTQIALEQVGGDASFFQNDVPAAFAQAADPKLKAEFAQTNAGVVAALQSYAAWLKADLLPRSHGDFRFGADTFSKKLAYDEMATTPLPRLTEIAMGDLHKNQEEFARVAKLVDPDKQPRDVLAELAAEHVAPDKLLEDFHDQFASEIAFLREHKIVTIPSDTQPTLQETPPFMRATTQAAMDSPGPLSSTPKPRTSMSPCRTRAGLQSARTNTWPASTWAPLSAPRSTRRGRGTSYNFSGSTRSR